MEPASTSFPPPIRDTQAPPLAGLVIAGTGLGHIGINMYEAVKEARDRGLPVVITTRVPTGRVIPLYAGKGQGLSLRDLGCILGDNLSPQKARVLLMVALAGTRDSAALQRFFGR